MKEYADDNFHQHIAVDSGDWEEVTEGDYILLQRWASKLKSPYASEYPCIVRQDAVSISQRILECQTAKDSFEKSEKSAEEKRQRSLQQKQKLKKEREREEYEKLKAKYEGQT